MEDRGGPAILRNACQNRGTRFTREQRDKFGLTGWLPSRVTNLQEDIARFFDRLEELDKPIEKFCFLSRLAETDQQLFYAVALTDVGKIMPLIYTPVVGEACQKWDQIYERPRLGMYITSRDKGRVREVLDRWCEDDVRIIVITDGERILGLGDLGMNGMGIPIGKLFLYTICAGISPSFALPITLDVGTNREELRTRSSYLGVREKRLQGNDYFALVDEFVYAVKEKWPHCLIQWEDFGNQNAFPLLEKYEDVHCSFNDDIQGTAGVCAGAVFSAVRGILHRPLEELRFLFFGAGEAAIGIARLLVFALEKQGMSRKDANNRIFLVDSRGLVTSGRKNLAETKRRFQKDLPEVTALTDIVKLVRPTALIGVSAQPDVFSREVCELMCEVSPHPLIFALSNPTSKSECTAEQAYHWTCGRCVFASGSPFDEVKIDGKCLLPTQANNAYIFPGIGLAVVATEAVKVTEEMFFAAANALQVGVTEEMYERGSLFPPLQDIRATSLNVAVAVAEVVYDLGLTAKPRPTDLRDFLGKFRYDPFQDQDL